MESTLYQVQSLFYQGAYQGCIDLALSSTSNARSSDPASVSTLLYAARSHLARSPSDPSSALSLLSSLTPEPQIQAIQSLARFIQATSQNNTDVASREIVNLTELLDHAVVGEDKGQTIRCAAATALFLDGDAEEALNTLGVSGSGGSKEIECVALGVHILLSIHRLDLAEKEYLAARTWADDSLLIQLIEAWIGLAKGGRSTQQAFYVYDELAQNPSAAGTINAVPALIGKATALAANGDWSGAKKQLEDAAKLDPDNAEVLANRAVVETHSGGTAADDYLQQLKRSNPTHPLVVEYEALQKSFDQHAQNFSLGASVEA
ncbi:Coatomer subunit epsilon [Pseudozyma hubeiensis]|nr:Coatomer subunit epsilon [Pseudozyma hubeiensis]